MENGVHANDKMVNQVIDKIYRKIETKFDDLLLRLMNVKENATNQGDYTIADVARIIGCGKNKAYNCKHHGEYSTGATRMIRRDVFDYRRAQGLNVCKGE
jgi:nitrogen regulatory protein PII